MNPPGNTNTLQSTLLPQTVTSPNTGHNNNSRRAWHPGNKTPPNNHITTKDIIANATNHKTCQTNKIEQRSYLITDTIPKPKQWVTGRTRSSYTFHIDILLIRFYLPH